MDPRPSTSREDEIPLPVVEKRPRGPSTSSDEGPTVFPVKKRQKGSFTIQEKRMILHAYNQTYHTWPQNEYWSKVDCSKKVANLLGVSVSSVYAVIKEHKEKENLCPPKKPGPKKLNIIEKLDEFTFCAVRRIVHQFFSRNEPPTVNKIHDKIAEDPDLPTFSNSTVRRILIHLNFKYASRKRRSNLIERQDIIAWRQRYLLKINDYRREGRHIYYQDETWLNEGHTLSKVWVDETIKSPKQAFLEGLTTGLKAPTGKGRRLIICHIGSEEGFLDNGLLMFESKKGTEDYHQEMNSECFEEWFKGILPKLKNNSVVVIDNAPYHSRKSGNVPHSKTKKADLQEWLRNKNIHFEPNMVRATLLELVQSEKHKHVTYAIDEMAAAKDIIVLRLPPYHCELNPIELIWAQVKGYVSRHNKSFKLNDVKKLFLEALNNVTSQNWSNAIEHAKKEEQKFLRIDNEIDEVTERFLINVTDDDSDTGDDLTDNDE